MESTHDIPELTLAGESMTELNKEIYCRAGFAPKRSVKKVRRSRVMIKHLAIGIQMSHALL